MNTFKEYIFGIMALVIIFVLSAWTLGEYHSALSVIYGFAGCALYAEALKRGWIKFL